MKPKSRSRTSYEGTKLDDVTTDVALMGLILPDSDNVCSVCQAEFVDPEELSRHVMQVHLTKFIKERLCKFCNSIFPSVDLYAEHIRDVHLAKLRACEFCSRVFDDEAKMLVHQKKHRFMPSKSMYSCSQCPLLFCTFTDLETHEYECHEDCMEGVMLRSCYPYLSAILNIKAETFLQSLGSESVYICVQCYMETSSVRDYIKHLQTKKCMSYVCNACSNVYAKIQSLKNHFVSHSKCFTDGGQPQMEIKCKKCNNYIKSDHYKSHQCTCKDTTERIACKICKINFENISQLSEHQTQEHPMSVTLQTCKYCRNDFVGTVALKKHFDRSHKSEVHLYKYKCKACNELYKHPKYLFSHFYSKHRDLKPYTCMLCEKKFRMRKMFTLHIKLDHKSIGRVVSDENFFVYFTYPNTPKVPSYIDDHNYSVRPIPVKDAQDKDTAENPRETQSNANDSQIVIVTESALDSNMDGETILTHNTDNHMEESQPNWTKTDLNTVIATDTDNYDTNPSEGPERVAKRKRKRPKYTISARDLEYVDVTFLESSEDEVPLAKIKRKRKPTTRALRNALRNSSKRVIKSQGVTYFICDRCGKNCYTFQNYNRHMSLHSRNQSKQCIKCGKLFKVTKDLEAHMKNEHSQSKLTETLQKLLERRKRGVQMVSEERNGNNKDRFKITIKKVDLKSSLPYESAKITIRDTPSVRNFLESFTPDTATEKDQNNDTVSIKLVRNHLPRKPVVEMTRVNMSVTALGPPKLAKPVKFKEHKCRSRAKIRIMQVFKGEKTKLNYGNNINVRKEQSTGNDTYSGDDHDNDHLSADVYETDTNKNGQSNDNAIPDVAQEVYLEGTEDNQKARPIQRKILIPHLPPDYNQVRIAHLQPQAPYYKIVKVDDILKPREEAPAAEPTVRLPEGTKLINVNPLEHLLAGKQPKVIQSKYYQPKRKNFQNVIARALVELENAAKVKKSTTKRKGKTE